MKYQAYLFGILALAMLSGCPPDDDSTGCPAPLIDNQDSPAWQVPISVHADDVIIDYGVIEYDNRARDVTIRLVTATPVGPDVLHGPVTVSVPLGEASISAGMTTQLAVPHAPLLIQIWRPSIAAVNNGRIVGVWVRTLNNRLTHFSAIAGNGAGTTEYMQPLIDWIEP